MRDVQKPELNGIEPHSNEMSIWTKLTVIMVIIAIVGSVFLCSFMGIYFNPFIPEPGVDVPTAALEVSTFPNPDEGKTKNSGGWVATVKDLKGPVVSLSKLTVYVGGPIPGGSKYYGVEAVDQQNSDVYFEGPTSGWYLHKNLDPIRFVDQGNITNLTNQTAKDVEPDEFATIEGASLIFMDNDGDGNLSIGDSVQVFQDIDFDGTAEVKPTFKLVLESKGGRIGEIHLGPG